MTQVESVATLRARDGNGVFIRTAEQMAKDHEAADMRRRSMKFREIGEYFGVTMQAAALMVSRAIEDIPKESTKELIQIELDKLDAIERKYLEVVGRFHPVVTMSGKLVVLNDREAILEGQDEVLLADDTPTMQALAGLLKVSDRRAKLLGLNAPTRTELTSVVSVSIEDKSEQAKGAVLSLLARLADE